MKLSKRSTNHILTRNTPQQYCFDIIQSADFGQVGEKVAKAVVGLQPICFGGFD
jgi:hypothetical protein